MLSQVEKCFKPLLIRFPPLTLLRRKFQFKILVDKAYKSLFALNKRLLLPLQLPMVQLVQFLTRWLDLTHIEKEKFLYFTLFWGNYKYLFHF